jgi:APA family basic amino acid/polyamine antiporter
VPLGGVRIGGVWIGYVPVAAIVTSFVMTLPVALDIVGQARRGDWLSVSLLGIYALAGFSLYLFYGRPRARGRLSSHSSTNTETPTYAENH